MVVVLHRLLEKYIWENSFNYRNINGFEGCGKVYSKMDYVKAS
jgi:hypothetical protein